MKINTRKILVSIGLLIALAGGHCLCFGETVTISYSDTFNPGLPTATPGDATATEHSNGHISFGAAGIYKGKNANYLMFVSGKGYLYNTESLGQIDSVIITYSSNVAAEAKYGVYFGTSPLEAYTDDGNEQIKGKSSSDTVINNNTNYGFFQLSTSNKNCQIVSIKIVYTQSVTPIEDITPPTFSTNYPKTENATKSSFDLKVKANEPCTVYYQILTADQPIPAKEELLASDKTITIENGNTEYTVTVDELQPETNYKVYLIAKDTADNVQENVTTTSVTTLSAFVKTIALGNIEAKYYWGETAHIEWTPNNFTAATDNDSIIIYKGNQKILKYPIDITSGEADILIGNGTAPDNKTYATDYKLKVISGSVESELSDNFTIVPTITINRLITDTTTSGESNFKSDIVRVKGLVTGTKGKVNKNFTIQDGDGTFCAMYVLNCSNSDVAIGDSVTAEGLVGSTTGMIRIGRDDTPSNAFRINYGNNIPEPLTLTIAEIRNCNGLTNRIIRIKNAKFKSIGKDKCLYVGTDSIFYNNTFFDGTLENGRIYDISGALGKGTSKRLELWPRSEVPEDFYLYSNDITLAEFTIDGQNALTADTLIFNKININGISATPNNTKASLSIRVNNNVVAPVDWAETTLAPLDSVFVTVTAEDGTEKTYKRIIDCKTLNFSPLATNSFGTGDEIILTWTSHNISKIGLIIEIQNDTIQLSNSDINTSLGEWHFIVPDAMFGEGWVKAIRNGTVLDCIAVTISDTKAPMLVRQSPANESDSIANSLYINMIFDEQITIAENAKLKISDLEFPITAVGDSAAKAFVHGLDFGTEYSVELPIGAIRDLAGNSATLPTWTFTTRTAPQPDLYFSEYAKGSSKYYEIYNPCDTAVDLSRYFVTMDKFSTTREQVTLQLSGWLMSNEVLVVANSGASAEIKRMADVSTTKTTDFTGDDLLGLFRKNGDDIVLIDVLGPFGNCDVAANWVVAGDKNASSKKTIVRDVIICGTTDWKESAGTDSLDSQWRVLGENIWTSLGRHGIGHNAEILRMSIGGTAATVDGTEATVSAEVPYRTNLTKLAVSRRISQGAQMFINDSLAADTIDFSLPVTVTVVAADSVNHKDWTIIVTMAPKPSSENNILTFKFAETTPISVSIDTTNATIDAVVAFNLDSLKLTPIITISDKAKVSSTLFRSSRGIFTAKSRWDFNEPQTIAVTAEDLTVKNWTVSVTKEPEPSFTFSPLTSNSFKTNDIVNLSWVSQNISQISFTIDIQDSSVQLTESAISADLGSWQYTIPDAMFGEGWVKAVRNGVVLDSIAVTISDTKVPRVVWQSPENGSLNIRNSLYISMTFDERITIAENAKLKISGLEFPITAVGDSAAKAFVSGLDYSTLYTISVSDGAIKDLAGNSATLPTWTFTTRTAPQPDLYFSEYAKGSGSNKYYEIYNPCDTAVDLSRYFVMMNEFKPKEMPSTLQLSGVLLPNEVLIVANSSAAAEIKQKADVSTTKTTNFTGDDLLGLFRKDGSDTVLIDVLGPFGNCDTAKYWSAAGVEKVSTEHTIVRSVIICGTTDWAESAGTDSLDSQWTVLSKDIWSNLGLHGNGHNVEILKMSIGGKASTVNSAESTVSVEVPYGTDLTQLAVSCRLSQGAQMSINGSLAADTIDFSQPVTATIISSDGINQKEWTITVTMAPKPSSEANILSFSFVETIPISVSIDTANATIDVVLAFNLDSLKLTPVITISDKAKVSSTLFKSSKGIFTAKTRWDFDEPQSIEITAEDLRQKSWNVQVTKEPEPHLAFSPLASNKFCTGDEINISWTSYNISKISFILDIQNNTIQLTDSAINADLGAWNFVVPDAVFGNGWVKAERNGIAIDSIAVSIADTKTPIVVRQTPANRSTKHANSLYISMIFDEAITIAEDTKLKVGNIEALIVAVNDTMVKAFISGLDFGNEYSVELPAGAIRDLAGNSATLPTWTFTTKTAPLPDLYFSEYAKGSSNNKYYEIYNPCDTAVDLSRYFVTMDAFSSNGSRSQNTLQLSGWLLPNEVLVVANSSAATAIKQNADVSTTKTTTFTGDDLLGLFRKDGSDTVLIDVLGPFGNCETAANWGAAGIADASTNRTIIRKLITCGTADWNESAGTDSLDSQWMVLGKDDWSDLGRHGIGHNADILKMSIGGIEANIYPAATGVLVEVPYGTDLTRLAVSYRISQGAQMFINDSLAADTIDLSQPVTATVIAGDSVNQKVWTIIVTMAPKPSSDNNILTFSFVETAPISVTIDTANATIDAIMAYNLDSLRLTPVITIAEFASVSSTLFKSSKRVFTAKTKWDFNEPQTIKVTAEDLTEKVWSVRVDWEKSKKLTIKDIAKLDGGLMANIGKPISTEGIVTHIVITSKGAEIHIQDSTGMWSGIMVLDEGNLYAANVAVGDRIKVSGVIAENFGMTCIEQIEALAITSSDNRILTDTIIVEDALSTAYQNAIVTIDSVVCTGGFENLFAVSDSTNSILIYNKYRISDFALEIDSMYRITGIVYYTSADNSYRIIPRSADDIVKLVRPLKPEQTKPEEQKPEEQKPQEPDTTTVGIAGTHIGLTAYTIGRTIVVENAEATVTVFDIAGRLIATARPARRIAISAPHSGIYIVGTRQGAIKVRVD